MNASIQTHLALILFLPWFTILCTLFWMYPRQPRNRARRMFDAASIALALLAFVATMRWGYVVAVPTGTAGNIWRQVLATASAYGVFLVVMVLACIVRTPWLRTRR